MKCGDVCPVIPQLLLPRAVHLLDIVEVLLNRRAIRDGFERPLPAVGTYSTEAQHP